MGFQPRADHPVEVQRKDDEQQTGIRRQEHKGDEPPDLSLKDEIAVKVKQGTEIELILRIDECVNGKNDRHAEYDNVHQIRDRKFSEFPLQLVQPSQLTHGVCPP